MLSLTLRKHCNLGADSLSLNGKLSLATPLHYVRFIQHQIITNLLFPLICCILKSASSPDRTCSSAHSGPVQRGSTGA